MIDPATAGAVISGLVSTLTAYMTYRVGMKNAEQPGAATVEKPDDGTLKQGEAVLAVVEQGVAQHGNADERMALAGFLQNPQMFQPVFAAALKTLAVREQAFAQQLQTLAQQGHNQTGGVHISGGSVYGNVMEQNTGTLNSTYNFGSQDKQ